mgnify:CR=1 FL=1
MRRFTPILIPFAVIACSEGVTTPDTSAADAPAVAFANTTSAGTMAQLVRGLVANGQQQGVVFLPPFSIDDDGNIHIAGTGGVFLSDGWPNGNLKHVCLAFTSSPRAFFRIGPNQVAFDHVNGPADLALIARYAEDGTPLPDLAGTGKLNLKFQGELLVNSFPIGPTNTINFYNTGTPTAATVISAVGKVGETAPDQHLRCGITDDANGNRRNGYVILR